jgi:hypothetical protein
MENAVEIYMTLQYCHNYLYSWNPRKDEDGGNSQRVGVRSVTDRVMEMTE